MSYIHDIYIEQAWGGCIHCEYIEKPQKMERELKELKDNLPEYTDFVPDPLYYHKKLTNFTLFAEDSRFIYINYHGLDLKIPKKILKYSQGNIYAHKPIFNSIVTKALEENN